MNPNGLKLFSIILLSLHVNVFGVRVRRDLEETDDDDFVIDLKSYGERLHGYPVRNDEKIMLDHENPEENGPYLEGDLLIPLDSRSGMKAESYRWKKGEIPFEIHGDFSKFWLCFSSN